MKLKLTLILFAVLLAALLYSTRKAAMPSLSTLNSGGEEVRAADTAEVKLPMKKEASPVSNYYEKIVPLDKQISKLASLSEDELQGRLKGVEEKIATLNFIDRANKNELAQSDRELFARLMHEESALKIVLLERKLEKAEAAL